MVEIVHFVKLSSLASKAPGRSFLSLDFDVRSGVGRCLLYPGGSTPGAQSELFGSILFVSGHDVFRFLENITRNPSRMRQLSMYAFFVFLEFSMFLRI